MDQEKLIEINYKKFTEWMDQNVRYKGTEHAYADCQMCGCKIKMTAFTAFMYPDYTIKALCNPCGQKEFLRLDYKNKN